MIRFLADTWGEALLRPVAMAAPNSSTYIEIIAPDFRYVLALILGVLVLVGQRNEKYPTSNWLPVLALFSLVFFSFVPWMLTSGNGRYFMPYLLLVGPLCVGLIYQLTSTINMKIFLVIAVLALQGFALSQNNPWRQVDSWTWLEWKDAPYFPLDLSNAQLDPESVYISITVPTYSLAAPLFPPSSRWININTFDSSENEYNSIFYAPVKKILQDAKSLKLFIVSSPRSMAPGSIQPNQEAINQINSYISAHNLKLAAPVDCQLSRMKSMTSASINIAGESQAEKDRIAQHRGFWICSIEYASSPILLDHQTTDKQNAIALFEAMEKICPRFFPPGQQGIRKHNAGLSRRYFNSDALLIATRDGHLYIKHDRALNPQRVGNAAEILSPGFTFDCGKIKGRSGLPWERDI